MLQRTVAGLTAGAKFGSVALAVAVGGYLIVNAQQRANPQHVESAPALVVEQNAEPFGAMTPVQVDASRS